MLLHRSEHSLWRKYLDNFCQHYAGSSSAILPHNLAGAFVIISTNITGIFYGLLGIDDARQGRVLLVVALPHKIWPSCFATCLTTVPEPRSFFLRSVCLSLYRPVKMTAILETENKLLVSAPSLLPSNLSVRDLSTCLCHVVSVGFTVVHPKFFTLWSYRDSRGNERHYFIFASLTP
jgi:hypothetical protein